MAHIPDWKRLTDMVNGSSKFGVGMRQSIVAFIIMILLIVVASNFTGELTFPWGSITRGYQLALAALPGNTPAATAEAAPVIYKSSYLPFVARAHAALPAAQATPVITATQESHEEIVEEWRTQVQDMVERILDPDGSQPADVTQAEVPASPEMTATTQVEASASPSPTVQPEEVGFVAPLKTPVPEAQSADTFIPHDVNYIEDQERSWEDYAGPSLWLDMEVPAPMGILAHPEDQVNVLLLGSDQREGDYGFRTDTIQLLTINPSQGTVKLTAFPRDLYVYIPGYTMERINTAFGWGGFEALANTMEYNFGVKPEYYVLINFSSFVDVVDSLGGITVKVGRDLCDHRDAFGEFCVSQSDYWMNGDTALWYVRSRYTTSDLDRGRRQQEVLEAIFNQLISIDGLVRAPELYEIYKENVTTNLTFDKMMSFIPLAAHLAEDHEIGRYAMGEEQVYDWVNYYGAMVLVPIRENVLDVMRQAVSEP